MAPEFSAGPLTLLRKNSQWNVLPIVFGAANHFNEQGVMS
jgi:hypothetical protein